MVMLARHYYEGHGFNHQGELLATRDRGGQVAPGEKVGAVARPMYGISHGVVQPNGCHKIKAQQDRVPPQGGEERRRTEKENSRGDSEIVT